MVKTTKEAVRGPERVAAYLDDVTFLYLEPASRTGNVRDLLETRRMHTLDKLPPPLPPPVKPKVASQTQVLYRMYTRFPPSALVPMPARWLSSLPNSPKTSSKDVYKYSSELFSIFLLLGGLEHERGYYPIHMLS